MNDKRPREPPNRPQCPACDSKYVRYRVKRMDFWCRRCGKSFVVIDGEAIVYTPRMEPRETPKTRG